MSQMGPTPAPVLRSPPATLAHLTAGRRYTVLGESCLYVGRTPVTGQHLFESRRGLQWIDDGWGQELMARGEIVPEGPPPAA